MEDNTKYGGGYTCGKCGKWNRSSIICDHGDYLGLVKHPKLEERRQSESFKKLKESMEDRIEINGVWYVRQDSIKQHNTEVEFNKEEVTHTRRCVYETDKYCWEASILVEEDDVPKCRTFGTKVSYLLTIKFTDKRTDTWKEDYWDSMTWFEGALENNTESLKELDGVMDEEGIKVFQKFLEYLKNNLGWL